ncbi:MAG: hypothetical protein KIT09_27100 [Bryobacteraceae bacterium]|nr:hypothetical protein [Bryobacteraceae bacterium]
MKPALSIVFVSATAAFLAAADPAGFSFWSGTSLRDYGKKLAPKINEKKVATEQLARYQNHSVMTAYREGDGEAEVHDAVADVFVIQSGEGTLVVGGTVTGGRSTGPGEIRGDGIEGGTKHPLRPGDIANIPAKTPHQVLVAPGKKITYLIVKVTE